MAEYDSPWKAALHSYLAFFLEFFFPNIPPEIDWERGYEVLDKELEQIVGDSETGPRLADKLFKVWLHEGKEIWVLIHVEIQSQRDANFPRRMFVYHYRIFDRYNRDVVSLAILGDDNIHWCPSRFHCQRWGCSVALEYPTVKLMDWCDRLGELERSSNPFGLMVAAHLQSMAFKSNPEQRLDWKTRLVKQLLRSGMAVSDVREFFRFVDWLLQLPRDLEDRFHLEIVNYEKENHMPPYISSIEQKGLEQGIEQGRVKELVRSITDYLQVKFPESCDELVAKVSVIKDVDKLTEFQRQLWQVTSLDNFSID